MTTYRIYIRSNEHPRTINTPKMARTYFTCFEVAGKENALAKAKELIATGEQVLEITTVLGRRIYP